MNSGLLLILCMLPFEKLQAQTSNIEDAHQQFRSGQYAQCLENAQKAMEERSYDLSWRVLYLKTLLAVGRYDEALDAFEQILRRFTMKLHFYKLGHTIYLYNGKVDKAQDILGRMISYGRARGLTGLNSVDIVALGEALLLLGAEPRTVLDEFFNNIIARDPECREAYIAAGNLALDKNDFALAGDFFQKALKQFNDDPDMHYGLARAFYHSDREVMLKALDAALHINANHAASLLLLAEHQIDAEDLIGARKTLERIHAVNGRQVEAWAFRSLLAYLDNDPNTARECREKALEFRPSNPKVDYLIGKKLSQKYRFAEGAAYQQLSLKFDVDYQPAKIQLAQDLLRLGYEEQGWQLVQDIYETDAYNVEAYNLVNLNDHMAKFKTLKSDEFIVRMSESEADVFGDMVLELLIEAKAELCGKYGLKLDRPVVTEMFDNQQDFAVRTFGMPDAYGFLGVCFGHVITMNSPKAERPMNWKATLWHEFSHVVTLNLTQNKMPRWLSEGISVYEESQKDPTWGQYMNPEFRRMILDGEMTPLGKLSGAFINPPTPTHLLFAYYESSLAVEYIITKYGLETLKVILADLAQGDPINEALVRHADKLEALEKEFTLFVIERAEDFAPEVDWESPDQEAQYFEKIPSPTEWLEKHPNSLWALTQYALQLIRQGAWEEAKTPLNRLIELYPNDIGEDNPYLLLAEVHRQLGETELEYRVLDKLASRSADATSAFERLVDLAVQRKDWKMVVKNGQRYLAVNPMLGKVHYHLGLAYETLAENEKAVKCYERLLHLDPADPADVHYRLALLLKDNDPEAAKKHVLLALADAPRFRAAHKLLLELVKRNKELR
ncbi:MAG: hypothetical protein AMJ79_06845 [Phycisphaerae bacterium SM23_30]|nr:MAG: hypothetical protein AMJ79_06845 [Phycisphaerae bacterium SM23_30]